ncbi:MAG: AraC family transcriptional regulator, partial [Cyclobacteriaceae bacterium]|nr:AraC family transcriptional regulator [Cyclobacteriaceae bacterium SS2]
MEDYNKIIESLGVRFIKAKNINILKPVTVENNYDIENTLILVTKGSIKFGKEKEQVNAGEILFIPGGRLLSITYGSGNSESLSKDDFLSNRESYLRVYETEPGDHESYSYVSFEAKAFDSVNFFASLDIPPFKITSGHSKFVNLISDINSEIVSNAPGKGRVVKLLTERLVVELIRYILKQGLFVEQFATNSTYFKDPRLIDIFTFIKENLGEDLSNK